MYHVINRGNYKAPLFADDPTKAAFVACLLEGCQQAAWTLHAYVVMRNHFHLAIETPRPNLAAGVQWLQSTFATRFNRFRSAHGHIFQGRYQALLVQPGGSLARVVHYIHLNPMRAQIVPVTALGNYPWSSYRALQEPARPVPLSCARWLAELGVADDCAGWQAYARYLEWFASDASGQATDQKELTRG